MKIGHLQISATGAWSSNDRQRLHNMEGYHDSTLQWRHNERGGVSNHRRLHCLLNRLFRRISKKTSKLRATGICEGNPPVVSPHKGPVTRRMFPFDGVMKPINCGRVAWHFPGISAKIFPYRHACNTRCLWSRFEYSPVIKEFHYDVLCNRYKKVFSNWWQWCVLNPWWRHQMETISA